MSVRGPKARRSARRAAAEPLTRFDMLKAAKLEDDLRFSAQKEYPPEAPPADALPALVPIDELNASIAAVKKAREDNDRLCMERNYARVKQWLAKTVIPMLNEPRTWMDGNNNTLTRVTVSFVDLANAFEQIECVDDDSDSYDYDDWSSSENAASHFNTAVKEMGYPLAFEPFTTGARCVWCTRTDAKK